MTTTENQIPGYTYGTSTVAKSPLSDEDFEKLKSSVGFTDEDVHYLRLAGEVLTPQMEAILDDWYGFLNTLPHIGYYTTDGNGNPLMDYPITMRFKPFLDQSPEDVEKMQAAWFKSMVIQITLWSHPYVTEDDF